MARRVRRARPSNQLVARDAAQLAVPPPGGFGSVRVSATGPAGRSDFTVTCAVAVVSFTTVRGAITTRTPVSVAPGANQCPSSVTEVVVPGGMTAGVTELMLGAGMTT